jgi:hypothetical protein
MALITTILPYNIVSEPPQTINPEYRIKLKGSSVIKQGDPITFEIITDPPKKDHVVSVNIVGNNYFNNLPTDSVIDFPKTDGVGKTVKSFVSKKYDTIVAKQYLSISIPEKPYSTIAFSILDTLKDVDNKLFTISDNSAESIKLQVLFTNSGAYKIKKIVLNSATIVAEGIWWPEPVSGFFVKAIRDSLSKTGTSEESYLSTWSPITEDTVVLDLTLFSGTVLCTYTIDIASTDSYNSTNISSRISFSLSKGDSLGT